MKRLGRYVSRLPEIPEGTGRGEGFLLGLLAPRKHHEPGLPTACPTVAKQLACEFSKH
jgi:hypothetical protein